MGRLNSSELRLFHEGDAALFRRLVEEHSPHLLAVVRPFAGDLDEAHDLLQETWRRVFEKRATYLGQGTLAGWFYVVCRNVCLAAAQKSKSRGGVALDPEVLSGATPADPARDAEQARLRLSIGEALMALPARERDVVILRMLEQRSTRETAEALGCAEGTVKATLHHAMKKLRDSMKVWVR